MNTFNIETDELYQTLKYFESIGCGNQYFQDQEYKGRTVTINNKELINFANCCYLGLEKHPALLEASINALKKYGTQNPTSRSLFSSPLYKELETNLAKIFPGHPVVYGSTTMLHYAAMPLLIKEKDAIILDAYVHNSVRMASLVCKANGTLVIISKHNDMEFLKYLVKRLKKEGYRNIWYCADGIYSIMGNVCDVPGLNQILDEEENFYAYIDDAHGTGWSGKNGMGYLLGNYGLHPKTIAIESLSKSMACSGSILTTTDEALADYLKLASHTYIFSGQLAPSVLGALNASLRLHMSEEIIQYQNELLELIEYFKKVSIHLSLPLSGKENTPIFTIRVGETTKILEKQKQLIDKGFFTSTAIYPAVNKGEGGIRISITRHIKKSDIDNLLETVSAILQPEQLREPATI
jgi:7-keto-8-aminopelargonate synthetase-like enzyme